MAITDSTYNKISIEYSNFLKDLDNKKLKTFPKERIQITRLMYPRLNESQIMESLKVGSTTKGNETNMGNFLDKTISRLFRDEFNSNYKEMIVNGGRENKFPGIDDILQNEGEKHIISLQYKLAYNTMNAGAIKSMEEDFHKLRLQFNGKYYKVDCYRISLVPDPKFPQGKKTIHNGYGTKYSHLQGNEIWNHFFGGVNHLDKIYNLLSS